MKDTTCCAVSNLKRWHWWNSDLSVFSVRRSFNHLPSFGDACLFQTLSMGCFPEGQVKQRFQATASNGSGLLGLLGTYAIRGGGFLWFKKTSGHQATQLNICPELAVAIICWHLLAVGILISTKVETTIGAHHFVLCSKIGCTMSNRIPRSI